MAVLQHKAELVSPLCRGGNTDGLYLVARRSIKSLPFPPTRVATTWNPFTLDQMLLGSLLVPVLLASGAVAGCVKKIVMFGDSSSDSGRAFNFTKNNGPSIPSNAFFRGRFSDGPTWIEVLTEKRKVELDNMACGGATTSDKLLPSSLGGKFNQPLRSDGSVQVVPGVDTQVREYLAKSEPADKENILYAIWAGANDNFNNELLGLNKSGSFYAKAQYEYWASLAAAGAKNIMVVVPPPNSGFAISYGLELHLQVAKFQIKNLDVKMGLLQLPLTFLKVTIAPKLYGFKYPVSERCCIDCYAGLQPAGNAKVCTDPDAYILFDGTHPSAATHRIIADDAEDFIDAWWGFA
ncbi:hypothetical protein HDU67_001344 [Dinochytrium kinnereticum]|nr:hypothetical protein HDU67_001344 [Dinochytrium kinnereticum]